MTVTELSQETVKSNIKLTCGCFDILHRGHVQGLNAIADDGPGSLTVLINSDESVKRLKGDTRPINSQYDRKYILQSLTAVDKVIIFDTENISSHLNLLKPEIFYKSTDYTMDTLNKEELYQIKRNNIEVRFVPFVDGYSTTNIVNQINNETNN